MPCCAIILTDQAPSFRGFIIVWKTICRRIRGIWSAGIIRPVCHLSLLSPDGSYIHWILQVTSLNPAVTWHDEYRPRRASPVTNRNLKISGYFLSMLFSKTGSVEPGMNLYVHARTMKIVLFRYDMGMVTTRSLRYDDCRRPRRDAPAADR
jgi:hypothetical protein